MFTGPMSMPIAVKFEAIIAYLLSHLGCEIILLMPRRRWYSVVWLYPALLTKLRVYFLSDYVSPEISNKAATEARRILDSIRSIDEFESLSYSDIKIGKSVLSTALRRLRKGKIDLTTDSHRSVVRSILTISIETSRAAVNLIREVKPDCVVFHEKGYTPVAEIFQACISASIDTVQWCGAPKSDSLLFKRYNNLNMWDHPLSLSSTTKRKFEDFCFLDGGEFIIRQIEDGYVSNAWFNRQQLQTDKIILPKDEVYKRLGISLNSKVAVIFCHILYDATFFFGDSLYSDYQDWLIETVRCAISNNNLTWIIKVHPVNVWRSKVDGKAMEQLEVSALQKAFGKLPSHIKFMPADTEINTYSLFSCIDYGLTVRGTVGMELPCFGIPVITAGTGRYSGSGFTVDPRSKIEYEAVLSRIHLLPRLREDEILSARKYMYAALTFRPVVMKSLEITHNPQRIVLNTKALERLGEQRDLCEISSFILNSTHEDLTVDIF